MSKPNTQTLFLGTVIIAVVAMVVYLAASQRNGEAGNETSGLPNNRLERIPFDGRAAYEFLNRICDLGRRPSGSQGMIAQQKLLADHFTKLGGKVSFQTFEERHPENGSAVKMSNLIVEWHPERRERILLCAHYDTRPFPDQDPVNPRGRFIGANDGASGVAVLAEMGKHMPALESRYGVDFVLFDAEEFIFHRERDRNRYFLGSIHFSRQYAADPPPYTYRYGVLLDMVGDANLQLFYEKNSMKFAPKLARDIWNTASRLRVREFAKRTRHEVRDDHLPLNQIAKIPTVDVIDFDFFPRPGRGSYWHTEADTPDKCSAESLAKVGWVIHEWLKSVE